MKVIIDRIEGCYAVVELPDKSVCNMPLALLPCAKEGDVVTIETDKAETERREEIIQKKFKNLWKD